MKRDATKTPFWIFLLCAFIQEIAFLFLYSVGWSILNHFLKLSRSIDWGLTFLLAIYAFFIATIFQWLLLYFINARYLKPIMAVIFVTLAMLVYTHHFPYHSLFLLACLLAAMLLAALLFVRLSKLKKNPLTGTPNTASSDLLDDDWEQN